jgi:hypothetical protein
MQIKAQIAAIDIDIMRALDTRVFITFSLLIMYSEAIGIDTY